MDARAIEAIQNEEGRWVPQVEVSEKESLPRSIQWKGKTFDTKKDAENYAATYGVMVIKQRLKQGVPLEELEQE